MIITKLKQLAKESDVYEKDHLLHHISVERYAVT